MADKDRAKLSTCPVCGYTDTATDADVLAMAIEEHMRSAHNMSASGMMDAGTVKPTNNTSPVYNEPPAAAPVANINSQPGASMSPGNIGDNDHGTAPGDPGSQIRDPYDTEHGY